MDDPQIPPSTAVATMTEPATGQHLCEHGHPSGHWIGLPVGNDPDGRCPGPAVCPGSGGGYVEVYGWDRHTAEYWEPCELCGRSHRDNRPPRPWYDHLWEPWRSIAEWLVVRRRP